MSLFMAQCVRAPLAIVVFALVAGLYRVEARAGLRQTSLAPPAHATDNIKLAADDIKQHAADDTKLITDARNNMDISELACTLEAETGKGQTVALQTRLQHVGHSLQALAAAEVQLKSRQGTLFAEASSIKNRRAELGQLCGHLEEGRQSQQQVLSSSGDQAKEVLSIAAKLQGDYSAKISQLQGSQYDQASWLKQGSQACTSEFAAVDLELAAVDESVKKIEDQLKALEGNRKSAEGTRGAANMMLAELTVRHAGEKKKCEKFASESDTYVGQLQARRASVRGIGVTDCEVSAWVHGECSKQCAGGTKTLSRSVLRQAAGGAVCPKLSDTMACNAQPCKATCQLGAWSAWGQCSKLCNGGHRTRSRTVVAPQPVVNFLEEPMVGSSASAEMAMFDNDDAAACGLTHAVESCNAQTCGDECGVSEWGAWGQCTKACGGGKRGRRREKTAARHSVLGDVACQGWDSEFESCKPEACPANDAFKCGARQDLVVMLDSSELLPAADFETQKGFVEDLLGRFKLNRTTGGLAGLVIFGDAAPDFLPLTDSFDAISMRLRAASQGRGGKHLDVGLDVSRMQVFLGVTARQDAPKTVLVLLQGKPDSAVKAVDQASELKKLGVRVVIAVVGGEGSCIVNKGALEQIASEPAADNLFYVQSYSELSSKVLEQAANICPSLEGGILAPMQYLP